MASAPTVPAVAGGRCYARAIAVAICLNRATERTECAGSILSNERTSFIANSQKGRQTLEDGWAGDESPFHVGEQEVQERLGVRDIEDWARRVIRPFMPEHQRTFHTSLPFLVAGALDQECRPWATLLTGPEAFTTSPDPRTLIMEVLNLTGDPLESALTPGAHLGLLGIDLVSRRRNRINGRVRENARNRLIFEVDQAFGNCPQYIRERQWIRDDAISSGTSEVFEKLTAKHRDWIAAADTFFIASSYSGEGSEPIYGMDVSHRGGEPGFVRVVDDNRILFPDFAGNNHFNTLGNIILNPKVGFLFIDFSSGSLLQLTGRASIDWDSEAVAQIPGARRIIEFEIDELYERTSSIPLRWQASADSVRSLRLIEKTQESAEVASFVFEARDGAPLAEFKAGQFLPIELEVPGMDSAISRTYSLSGSPSSARYRICVKRESTGIASRYLHNELEVGAIIDARRPAGEDLMLPCAQCPVALVSAGIGITPMLSLLHALVEEDSERTVWFIHGARDGEHHVMTEETKNLSSQRQNVQLHVSYSKPRENDKFGRDFDNEGRVNGRLVSEIVTVPNAHYMLCGPTSFMAEIQSVLARHDIPADRIHAESFGPKG
ncbi:MAG: ferredoxin-NADP reductase [Gammaproteobacteria bacterium]|jgi:ferredoxin-NADP reductase/predicted pyridoxine 5'-phosphate oxidase superfamily flavin-nucleotide-binding protein